MNALVPATVALSEPDIEGIVLGSLIAHPEAMAALAAELNPEWFADPGTRMFLDAALSLHGQGHRVSPAVLISAVSPSVEAAGATRAQFIAGVTASAMPIHHLSGYVATLRDRWARRLLASEARAMTVAATVMEADPFAVASEVISGLDNITLAKSENVVGSLDDSAESLFEAIADPNKPRSPTTGLASLDGPLNGYAPGKLYVVAGRPGMAKSAFACSSLRRTAAAGHGVALFSLEMGREEIAARCISDAADSLNAPFFGNILKGLFSNADDDALIAARETFRGLPFHIDASPRLTFSEISARARKAKARFEAGGKRLEVLCVDHMGLVDPSDRYRGNKVAETGEISRAGKVLAKELNCCVLLLCQLNRGVEGREDKRPTLADLRWSGDIEQDADVVAFLFRESYYLAQQPGCDPADLMAAKHRLEFLIRKNRNGAADDVRLWCSIPHSSIRDMHHG